MSAIGFSALESYWNPQITGAGGQEGGNGRESPHDTHAKGVLPESYAFAYLKEVKAMFQDQNGKYDAFLNTMREIKKQRIHPIHVIKRVKKMFKGHDDLIIGFNAFLPEGYKINTAEEEKSRPRKRMKFEEAERFLRKVKIRFQNNGRTYEKFSDILRMLAKGQKSTNEVYREASVLFDCHPDLLEEFTCYLPNASATASAQIDTKQGRQHRIISSHAERHPSDDYLDIDKEQKIGKLNKKQKESAEKNSSDRRNHEQSYKETESHIEGIAKLGHSADTKKPARKFEGFGTCHVFSSCDIREYLKRMKCELTLCKKVKERLQNHNSYQEFLKCLYAYSGEEITEKNFKTLVKFLHGKHPDLMEAFIKCFKRCKNMESLQNEGHASKSVNADFKEKQKRKSDEARENERRNDSYFGKSIQECDLSNCEHCTPSYRLLPKDYPIPIASNQSGCAAEVLNDKLVSVASGRESYSFKHMQKNQYERSLFQCEDDRFELDMVLNSVISTAKRAEDLLDAITNNSISSESQFCFDKYFSAQNLRCIEQLYGDHGLDVMDILRENPRPVLPIVITRLKQKQKEWTKCRSEFNKVWAEVYAKNHKKALDHRSFSFKKQDSKSWSTKASKCPE